MGDQDPPGESESFEVPILCFNRFKIMVFGGGVAGGPINPNPTEPLPGVDKFCGSVSGFVGSKLFVSEGGHKKLDYFDSHRTNLAYGFMIQDGDNRSKS